MVKIDSIYDFSDKALGELKAWLEPWLLRDGGGALEWDDVGLACGEFGWSTYSDMILAHPCLAHYWPGDEISGDLVDRKGSLDLSLSTHDYGGETWPQYGAPGPLVEFPDQTAVVNDGLQGTFYANNGGFSTGIGPHSTLDAAFTVECWAYVTAYASSGAATLIDIGLPGDDHIGVFLFPSAPQHIYLGQGAVTISDPDVCPLNAWQYIVGRSDGTTLELFRNGVSVATDAADPSPSVDGGVVAWLNHIGGLNPFRGRSAHFAFYNCALTDAEIETHYTGFA